jgi:hypothetical protein
MIMLLLRRRIYEKLHVHTKSEALPGRLIP